VAACGKGDDVTALEAEVNQRVYRLFGLTRDEIALIEEPSEPRTVVFSPGEADHE
jgi:hypothetical protein